MPISARRTSACLRTTAYHPASNGLVERLHRHLKQALMARGAPQHWTENLPLVLLGIRAALKTDIQCSSAELVYGTTIRLPADVFQVSPLPPDAPFDYVRRLQSTLSRLHPTATRPPPPSPGYLPKALSEDSHIFLRVDRLRRALQAPYSGPHKVLRHGTKTLVIDLNGKPETVSIDRTKPAFIDAPSVQAFDTPLPSGPVSPASRPKKSISWAPLPRTILPVPPRGRVVCSDPRDNEVLTTARSRFWSPCSE
ncbi:uncharacterized protein LOC135398428 [Ornithodoros turicata]|uniref:uncharacterized protein LOC135398428 n=1 Tax=Ornithodoros turicata TaxID=34597 RepID=UPI003139CB06